MSFTPPLSIYTPLPDLRHRPLVEWAESLIPTLRVGRTPDASFEDVQKANTALNNAALISVHRGCVKEARRVCHAQIRWLENVAAETGEARVLGLSVQPRVNEARIEARVGDEEAALDVFKSLYDGSVDKKDRTSGEKAQSGTNNANVRDAGTSSGLRAALEARLRWRPAETRSICRDVWGIDGLKTMLASQRFERALALTEALDVREGSDTWKVQGEAAFLAHDALGHETDAPRMLANRIHATESWQTLIYRVRLCEFYLSRGAVSKARKGVSSLLNIARAAPLTSVPRPALALLPPLLRLASHTGLSKLALPTAQQWYAIADDERDVVLQAQALEWLQEYGDADISDAACRKLDLLRTHTHYASLQPTSDASTAFDRLVREIRRTTTLAGRRALAST